MHDPFKHVVFQAVSQSFTWNGKEGNTKGLHHLKLPINSRQVNLVSLPPQNTFLLHHQTRCGIALALFLHLKGHYSASQLHEQRECTKAFNLLPCPDNRTNSSKPSKQLPFNQVLHLTGDTCFWFWASAAFFLSCSSAFFRSSFSSLYLHLGICK